MWTGMKVFIELRDGVTLQLPFREASKVLFTCSLCYLRSNFVCRIGNGMAKLRSRIDHESVRQRLSTYVQEIVPPSAILSR